MPAEARLNHSLRRNRGMAKSHFDFSNRRVLVVGASRAGIGAAIADGFADAGATVTITGVEATPIESYVGRYPYRQLDVTDEAAVIRLAGEFANLDILVNCAGMGDRNTEWTNAGFKHVLDVNLVGMLNLANAFRPHLAASKGAVVAIASMYSFLGSPIIPAYGASKAGLAHLTKSAGARMGFDQRAGQRHRAGLHRDRADSERARRSGPLQPRARALADGALGGAAGLGRPRAVPRIGPSAIRHRRRAAGRWRIAGQSLNRGNRKRRSMRGRPASPDRIAAVDNDERSGHGARRLRRKE